MGQLSLEKIEREISAATGLSGSDFGVLSRLADLGDGKMRQQSLAESLGWDKSRLSHHLTRMQQRQLILRKEADQRVVFVVLTKEGKAKLDAARPIHADAIRRHLLARLTDPQKETIVDIHTLLTEEA
ncbi:MarR family winged helix-turn-helix transcriptional regulator [Silvibacterium sp.]|uniref:MarR family winged helix-turn-helix transcriptional regulator n=1 Tax=Silvibacterium sp. TaxID=1964179 RepID=UPI0039E68D8C